jgi:hypothetical protein
MLPSICDSLMHEGSLPTLTAIIALLCLGGCVSDLVCESHMKLSCGTTLYTHSMSLAALHLHLIECSHLPYMTNILQGLMSYPRVRALYCKSFRKIVHALLKFIV